MRKKGLDVGNVDLESSENPVDFSTNCEPYGVIEESVKPEESGNCVFIIKEIKQEPDLEITDEIPEIQQNFLKIEPDPEEIQETTAIQQNKCNICSKVFNRGKFALKRHQLECHGSKKYQCDYCNFTDSYF
jgi:hypothetical protein